MRLNHKTIAAIVTLSVVALIGLVWLQVRLLLSAAEQKEEAFRRTVASALAAITTKLETDEAVGNYLRWSTAQVNATRAAGAAVTAQDSIRIEVGSKTVFRSVGKPLGSVRAELPLRVEGNKVQYRVVHPQRVRLRVFDMLGREDSTLVDAVKEPGMYEIRLDSSRFAANEHTFQFSTDSTSVIVNVLHGPTGMEVMREVPVHKREDVIRGVFDRMIVAEQVPIEKRISSVKLDSVIAVNLRDAGIDLPYAYGVIAVRKDSLSVLNRVDLSDEVKTSEFRTRLFPNDIFAERNDLALFFPGRTLFLFRQMGPMIAATVCFMSIIVFCFAYTVWTIIRQKRMAGQMVDFINNMTHEFKTPISTIALASEAIARPEVLANAGKVTRFNAVIHDENTRMRHQVEKILQIAVLEEGDCELKFEPVDMHHVIRTAVKNIALQIEGRHGTISTSLIASRHVILADAVHVANIIHNLLDNANKYSHDHPLIEVSTANTETSLVVRVFDKGIGMSQEDAKRAFDKYYRVATGNQHDVKGFGLGLSYVKLMVDAHRGSATIESEPGKGTTVSVSFPQSQTETEGKNGYGN